MGFTLSESGVLGDIGGFIRKISGKIESEKPINITEIDKIHLKCDCINGSIINNLRQHILFSFAMEKLPGHRIHKEPRIKIFKRQIYLFCPI